MARFGQGVMPQLGATDYIPFMQGSIRGSESVARGIEMLGQAAAQGVQQYYQKQEEKQLLADTTGRVKQILGTNPAFAQSLGIADVNDEKALKAAIKGIGGGDIRKGAAVTNQMLMQLSQQEAQRQAAEQAAMPENLSMRTASSLIAAGAPDVLGSMSQMGLTLTPNVVRYVSEQQAREAETAKTRAQTDEILAGKPAKPGSFQSQTFEEMRLAEEQRLGRPLSTDERADLRMRVLRSGPQSTDPERAAATSLMSKRFEGIISLGESARRVNPTLRAISQKLEQGLKTGKLEGFKTDAIGFAKSLGLPVDEAALGDSEAARGMFNQLIIEYFQATKGAITERENALFMSMGPEFIKTPKANKLLLDLAADRNDLDQRLASIVNSGLAEGLDFRAITLSLKKATEDYDKMLEKKYGSSVEAASAAPTSTIPAGFPPLPPGFQYRP